MIGFEKCGWNDPAFPPNDDRYILLSFDNYDLPAIGRYDNGAYYEGDDDRSYESYGLHINAWSECPAPYREEKK